MQKALLKSALLILAASLTACSNYFPTIPGLGMETPAPAAPTPAENFQKANMVGGTVDQSGKELNVNITMAGGGEIGLKSMDAQDKSKMLHALDAATGKPTHWVNAATGISYTVTPIKKVVIQNNPFCRSYHVDVVKGSYSKQVNGTACVTTDGSWHTI